MSKIEEDQLQELIRKKVRIDTDDFIPLISTKKIEPQTRALPIYNVASQIIETMARNQVMIITGGTGCGKSTQVPQIIYNQFYDLNDPNKRVKILCTQPRRIAAKSLAKRVAFEMKEELGGKVGYQVGMDSHQNSKNTQILFVTTGIFLSRLVHDKEKLFEEFTHIIMDEVHERDIDIDFSLIITKHFLKVYPIKLILMSATISSQKFANYFSKNSIQLIDNDEYLEAVQEKYTIKPIKVEQENEGFGQAWPQLQIHNPMTDEQARLEKEMQELREEGRQFLHEDHDVPAPIINIPQSQKYVIDTYYLDDLHEFYNLLDTARHKDYAPIKFQQSLYFQDTPKVQSDSVSTMLSILEFIELPKIKHNHKLKSQKSNGAVLIFLPGYQEIMDCREAIFKKFGETHFQIIMLHSTITVAKEFDYISNDQRRVILSTNIAESSITVPDCLFVIDFCLSKEIVYNPKNLSEKLALSYCSRASCDQRKGRTGRLFPGFCFRLIPSTIFKSKMTNYSVCEMLRCPLEKIILRIKKIHSQDDDDKNMKTKVEQLVQLRDIFKEPKRTLSTALDPPTISQIDFALTHLQELGALNYLNAHITQLGKLMCELPIDIFLTKYILFANILGCGMHAVNVASILSLKKNFFLHYSARDQKLFVQTLYLYDKGYDDDILIQLRIYLEWELLFFGVAQFNQTQHELKRTLKSFTNKYITFKEKLFCKVKQIDPKCMREILNVKYEILMRLDKQMILLEGGDLTNPNVVFKMKSAFASAFKSNILQVSNERIGTVYKKIRFIKNLQMDPRRVLLIESDSLKFSEVPTYNQNLIKDKVTALIEQYCELNCVDNCQKRLDNMNIDIDEYSKSGHTDFRQFYFRYDMKLIREIKANCKNTIKWVNQLELRDGFIVVEFKSTLNLFDLQYIIKRIIHECDLYRIKKSNFSARDINWRQFVESNSIDFINLIRETNTIPFYSYHNKMDCQYHEIYCDLDSINHVTISHGKERDANKMMVAYEIQEKDQGLRNSARQVLCIMSENHIGFQLSAHILILLFGINVQIFHNNSKTHFIMAKVDDREYYFDHFLTLDDIYKINDIRSVLKERIQQPAVIGEVDIWDQYLSFNKIRQRIYFNSDELWRPLFEQEWGDEIKKIQAEGSKEVVVKKRVAKVPNFEDKAIMLDFMNPIQIIKTETDMDIPQQFDDEGILIYSQINQLYYAWKKNIIKTINLQNFFMQMQECTHLVCAECEEYITFSRVTGLKTIDEDEQVRAYLKDSQFQKWMRQVVMILDVHAFGDYFKVTIRSKLIEDFLNDQLTQLVFERLGYPLEPNQYIYISCAKETHVVGFYPKFKLTKDIMTPKDLDRMFILDSKLKLIFTTMEEVKFQFWKITIRDIIQEERKKSLQLQPKITFSCKCCYEDKIDGKGYFKGDQQEYAQHIRKETHKTNFEEIQRSIDESTS